MVNEWKALERAGEWAGLEGAALDDYVVLVADIYNTEMGTYGEFENYEQEYFNFLNEQVFSDERVVDLLRSLNVDGETVDAFQAGSVPVMETYHTEQLLDHGLDELVDLIMMLKLLKRYTTVSNQDCIRSRYRFQKLLFVTNLKLKQTQTESIVDERELGLLETTGYRYSFTKRSSGPFSKEAYIDKDRLYANGLIEEDVTHSEGTGEVAEHEHTYAIKLSRDGELLLSRFSSLLTRFQGDILFYWDQAQEDAIEAIVGKSIEQIRAYISDEGSVESRETGETLLPPRQNRFESEANISNTIGGAMSDV